MPTDDIQYDVLVHEALRGVVRMVLDKTVREGGLPGEHHFFITFRTDAPGVELPESLKADFPEEMTIVLQHQFSNLEVSEQYFGVTLSFGGVPRHLRVPYAAIVSFFDPSVQFALQFAQEAAGAPDDAAPAETPPSATAEPADADDGEPKSGDVVQLDSFRKK